MPVFNTNIDLANNEIRNAKPKVVSSNPSTAGFSNAVQGGTLIYNSTDGNVYVYDGIAAAWVDLTFQLTFPLKANPDGTAAAPSYTWLSDQTSGLYYSSGFGVAVSVSGAQTATFQANGLNLVSGSMYRINNVQIASANLSDGGNLGKINNINNWTANQAFTVGLTVTQAGQTVDMGNNRVQNVAYPTAGGDAATKTYVDTWGGGDAKKSVRAVATGNIPLTGGTTLTIDGVSIANNERVLLAGQTTGAQNGIYFASGIGTAYILNRDIDADVTGDITLGTTTYVEAGTSFAKTIWTVSSTSAGDGKTITVGTDTPTFTREEITSSGNQTIAGAKTFTNPVIVPNGSSGSPSVQFATDSGIWRTAAGGVTIDAVATSVAAFSGTGLNIAVGTLTLPNGTAAAPTHSFLSEASGMYRAGSSQLGFSAAGVSLGTWNTASLTIVAGNVTVPTVQISASGPLLDLNGLNVKSGAKLFFGITASDVLIKKDTTGVVGVKLGDDSGYADIKAANATFTGNLTVQGTTTSINSNTISVGDNIIQLNNDVTTTVGTTEDAGIEINRYAAGNVQQITSLLWNETTEVWTALNPPVSNAGAAQTGAAISKSIVRKHVVASQALTSGGTAVITHNLGTKDVTVAVYDTVGNGNMTVMDVETTDFNNVTLTAGYLTGSTNFRVVITG